jgi:hypothetical protein
MDYSVDVDLSQELLAPTRPILQTQVEAAWKGRAIGAEVRFSFVQISIPFSLLIIIMALLCLMEMVSGDTSCVIRIPM